MSFAAIPADVENIAKQALDCCFTVHKKLGPGLVEKIYEACLCHELQQAGVPHQRQLAVPIKYDSLTFDEGFLVDVMVASEVVFELKAVNELLPRHEAQLMTYMKLSRKRLGFLINFNTARLKDGIRRRVI